MNRARLMLLAVRFASALAVLCLCLCSACGEDPPVDLGNEQSVRNLYIKSCGRCHAPHAPEAYTIAVWETQVAKFAPQVGLKGAERQAVLDYLRARAQDAPPPSKDGAAPK